MKTRRLLQEMPPQDILRILRGIRMGIRQHSGAFRMFFKAFSILADLLYEVVHTIRVCISTRAVNI